MGYGKVSAAGWPNGVLGAHVAAWMLWTGMPVPPGMDVCHNCTEKLCVNPNHLRVDSHGENMRDIMRWRRAVCRALTGQ